MPKISIVLAAHNAQDHIKKMLESIRSQSFTDYELIMVCDACTDHTAVVAGVYADKVIEVDYRNPGLARNAGLEAATGEWFTVVDDDDWFLHEFALEQVAEELTDDIDMLNVGFIWKDVGYTRPRRPGGFYWPAPWARYIRRSAIGDIRFPEDYPDDLLFLNELLSDSFLRIRNFDMPVYYYNYMREGSITDLMNKAGREPDLRRKKDARIQRN